MKKIRYSFSMDMLINANLVGNPLHGLRKAGYVYFIDPNTGEESYVCRLSNAFYPRYHLYVKKQGEDFCFSLHLDQKQVSYSGSSMHNGEYTGEHIERELDRVKDWLRYIAGGGK